MKILAVSLHGWRLQTLRYNGKTDTLVAQSQERESWSIEKWDSWQQERQSEILWHAAKSVPYYRDQWETIRRHGDRKSIELLENWPILTKEAIRRNPRAFVADGVNLNTQIIEHTSGTTGTSLTFWQSRDAINQWYALFEARWRGWYGLSRHDRWGILGGQLIMPYGQGKPPFWVWNFAMRQLYLSSYHITSNHVRAYLQAIQEHQLIYLLGYASSLYSLANLALEQNIEIPKMKAILSNAEPLYQHQREVISQAFQCQVYDTYGLSENICAASECLSGSMHLWPEVGITEILSDEIDEPVQSGETGRVICTGLLNKSMPLIRYDVGDRACFNINNVTCACGRNMPSLQSIDGRKDDVILTPDGRHIGRLDPVFKTDLLIREAQIIQEDINCLRVIYVPASGFNSTHRRLLDERLRAYVGNMDILIQEVNQIPRSSRGKFRAVISKLKAS